MAASASMIARLRRMTAEPTTDVYSDEEIAEYIERYPVSDADSVQPDDGAWVATYDLHAAAADIWEEKAALLQPLFDFSADGGSYDRSQAYEAAAGQARHHSARRRATSRPSVKSPSEITDESL